MFWDFERISSFFSERDKSLLLEGKWGIERESQRVTPLGDLALTAHPSAFGNKLENTEVTTDFSESQLELITPPFASVEEAHAYLVNLHTKVNAELKSEYMWPLSMPPRLPEEEEIPIAQFDGSQRGKEKELYRMGLAVRYGRKMQMISGIHFNFSFGERLLDALYERFGTGMRKQDFIDEAYFAAARNFLKYRWMLIYLFGASPAIDPTYYSVVYKELMKVRQCCPECCDPIGGYEKFATSLRVSRFGYNNAVQGRCSVSFNSKKEYIRGIRRLMSLKSEKFSKIGIFRDGKQIQLNTNILQKESEFYSPIRLKQVTENGETQLEALENRGVRYAEVRILDLDPFEREGIGLNEMRFLQVFMLFCLLEQSDFIRDDDLNRMNKNHHLVALAGRRENLMLYRYGGGRIRLKTWSKNVFKKLERIAEWMDMAQQSSRCKESGRYQECIRREFEKVLDHSLLPSSRMYKEMKGNTEDFIHFGIRKAIEFIKPKERRMDSRIESQIAGIQDFCHEPASGIKAII